MGLVYIEYISRLPGIDLETFRAQAAQRSGFPPQGPMPTSARRSCEGRVLSE